MLMKCQTFTINTSFRAGLNKKILSECTVLNLKSVENNFIKQYNIDAKFKDNKPIAYCFKKVLEAFLAMKNFRINSSLIPRIRVFTADDLILKDNLDSFCIPESRSVLKNELPFETGSIFQKEVDTLEDWNAKIENSYNNHIRSSNHFLSDVMHEFFHAVYIRHLYKKYGYSGDCPYTKTMYPADSESVNIMKMLETKCFNSKENKVLQNVLGTYSTTSKGQYHEVFAETFTKIFCESFSPELKFTKNPFETIKTYPTSFLKILAKVINV